MSFWDIIDYEDEAQSMIDDVELIRDLKIIHAMKAMQRPRRVKNYKVRVNPMSTYSDEEFRDKYRFTKNGVTSLIGFLKDRLKSSLKSGKISPDIEILIALRSWGRGQIQDDSADLHGVSQQSITNICRRVALAIVSTRSQFIKMPENHSEQVEVMNGFQSICGLPKIIGAIDGIHIKIPKVSGENGGFYKRGKKLYSLNVQVVCDASLKIRDIVARWGGSTPDHKVFNESRIKHRFEREEFVGKLIGDSNYTCFPYLLTPISNPRGSKDEAYNDVHATTRSCIDRCLCLWKQRFRCLSRGFSTSLQNTKLYIVALAVLHDFAIEHNEPPFEEDEPGDKPRRPFSPPQPTPQATSYSQQGESERDVYIQNNF